MNSKFNLLNKKVKYFYENIKFLSSKETNVENIKKKFIPKKKLKSSNDNYFKFRKEQVDLLKKNKFNLYPFSFKNQNSIEKINSDYQNLEKEFVDKNVNLKIAGRIISKRELSNQLIFIDILSNGLKLQVVVDKLIYVNQDFNEKFDFIKKGDIVGCYGHPGKTKSGQISLFLNKIEILAPCLRNLPNQYYGLEEKEIKYRMRFLDLILDQKSRNVFIIRSRLIKFLREYLDKLNFLEVETPILNSVPGGAIAKPFKTYHNNLNLSLFLRIAPELFLKMLVVGGFERVYEIGRQFRNEGIDRNHNPEFTMCEFYMAYADYNEMMGLVENILQFIVENIFGKKNFEIKNQEKTIDIDFSKKFKRIDYMFALENELNIKLPSPKNLDSKETNFLLKKICGDHNILFEESSSNEKLLDKLTSNLVEPKLIEPTFLINYPIIMSPLAKQHRSIEGLSERFELFINGIEISNGYSELNDPKVQRERFNSVDINLKDDNQKIDELFCLSLEYGMPPTGGVGIGIDRLAKILSNSENLRQVILFPTMRPDNFNDVIEYLEKS